MPPGIWQLYTFVPENLDTKRDTVIPEGRMLAAVITPIPLFRKHPCWGDHQVTRGYVPRRITARVRN